MQRFLDREDAGRRLATRLSAYASAHPIVLGLPRGGIPVAYEVARALRAPLDVWVARKVGVPWHPELGVGAVAEGGYVYTSPEIAEYMGLSEAELQSAVQSRQREVEERVRLFRGNRAAPNLRDRTVILVDDGIATGGTVRAATRSIRAQNPKRIVLAVPVATPEAVAELGTEVDDVLALLTPAGLYAIGLWYEDFTPVSDDEVVRLLELARGGVPEPAQRPDPLSLQLPAGGVSLRGDLVLPADALGLVLFAHGSGSSRMSTRNRLVARRLQSRGLATLLFDLQAAGEQAEDVALLARRLGAVTDWMRSYEATRRLPIGYFGSSTGAAAALLAAAERPDTVRAVVSRGGRPDLAAHVLDRIVAPTLLIVGSRDTTVLSLNEAALQRIPAHKRLAVVRSATHLFGEPGALEEVAHLAGDWFVEHLTLQEPRHVTPDASPVTGP